MEEKTLLALKALRLPGLLAHWDEFLRRAQRGRYSHGRFLEGILQGEFQLKQENARLQRLKKAQFPEHLVFETYPFHRQPNLDRRRLAALYEEFTFLAGHENILFFGPTGTGKTGLATAFLIRAIERGSRGRYVLFAELLTELLRSAADHSQPKVLRRYLSYDPLLVDEVGYGDVDQVALSIFFTLVNKRHKRSSTLLTSNLGFAEWHTFLKNAHLTAALVDRLTEKTHVINMRNCRSIRSNLEDEKCAPKAGASAPRPCAPSPCRKSSAPSAPGQTNATRPNGTRPAAPSR
jgi:DNA replication protein DnaC